MVVYYKNNQLEIKFNEEKRFTNILYFNDINPILERICLEDKFQDFRGYLMSYVTYLLEWDIENDISVKLIVRDNRVFSTMIAINHLLSFCASVLLKKIVKSKLYV